MELTKVNEQPIVANFEFQTKARRKELVGQMQSSRIIPFAALLAVVSVCSTLEAQLLSRPAILNRVVGRLATTSPAVSSDFASSGWYPYVVARPEDRYWIRETPVELRPNRPLHFWGNSRRRMVPGTVIQQGTVLPNVVPSPLTESIFVGGINR